MKVLVALGTRPEAIKLSPVISDLKKAVDLTVCSTGQHREMLAQTLDSFAIKPDIELDTMSPGRSLNILASRLLAALDGTLEECRPDWMIVQGDTTTALCAGLAAFHRGVRVAHVEAGLRTGDPQSPFPEEVNRCLLARIVNLHLAPTRTAASKLQAEGVSRSSIHIIGNTVVDAIYRTGITHSSDLPRTLPEKVRELCASSVPFVLVTCHRRENFGEVMEGICLMLARLARAYPAYQWVFPVHLNPAVREPVTRILGDIPNLSLLEPVDYRSSLHLIAKANLVISDSGGIQEEAPTFGTPVVIMRRHTERMEGVEAGFATLAGQDPQTIEAAARNWLDQSGVKERLLARGNPYGDGLASQRIVSAILGQPVDEFNG